MKYKTTILLLLLTYFSAFSQYEKYASNANSQIPSFELTSEKINDLSVLCKVWGFLKYYHPSVRHGYYNWDNELLRILPEITKCENKKERNTVLSNWINDVGVIEVIEIKKLDSAMVKLYPDLDWLKDTSELGQKIPEQLMQVKRAKRDSINYYAKIYGVQVTPNFDDDKLFLMKAYPDNGARLIALFRYWNIIQYYFPYKYLIGENWHSVLKDFIPKFINVTNELEYQLVVLKLIARIHDTHAQTNAEVWDFQGKNYAPFKITFIDNKAVVSGFYCKNSSAKFMLKRGDVILKVNSKDVSEIIKERTEYTSASNYSMLLRDIGENLLRSNDTMLNITFLRKEKTCTTNIPCSLSRFAIGSCKREDKDTCFRYISSDIGYIYIGNLKQKYLKTVMPVVLKTKGLIIDMRCYPSDEIKKPLFEYFFESPVAYVKITSVSKIEPGLFKWAISNGMVGSWNPNYYKGKLIVLINEQTQSASELLTMAFRTFPNAIIVGSTTAGADGNIFNFFLPGLVRTRISGQGVYYPDGKETQRIGIIPDIEMHPTIQGISENKDELLEKAVELINEKK